MMFQLEVCERASDGTLLPTGDLDIYTRIANGVAVYDETVYRGKTYRRYYDQSSGSITQSKWTVMPARNLLRIAVAGDSTAAGEHGTRWSTTAEDFFGRSDAPNHAEGDEGTLTIYSNGTATWQAAGDTVGPVTPAGDGFVWLESGSSGKGFGFNIVAEHVAAASPTGTNHTITVLKGSGTGYQGYFTGGALVWSQVLKGFRLDVNVLGTPGVTTFDLLARIDNALDVDSHGRRLSGMNNLVYVSCGISDCSALTGSPGYTIDDVIDNLTAIKNAVIARGACIIFSSLSHEAPGARRPFMDAVNAHFASMAAAQPDCVVFADYTGVVDDPESPERAARPGYMSGAHYYPGYGCYFCGSVLADLLGERFGSADVKSSYRDVRIRSLLAGDWTVQAGEGIIPHGDASVSVSTDPGNGDGEWTVLDVTGGTEDSYVIATIPLRYMPNRMRGECEFYINDLSKVGGGLFQGPRLVFAFYDAEGNILEYDGGITVAGGDLADDLYGYLKTDIITPPAGAVSAKLMFGFWVPQGNNAVVKLRKPGAEDVV